MAKDRLTEITQFLKPDSRLYLKHISVEYLRSLTASEDGVKTLLEKEQVMQSVIEATDDRIEKISKYALLILVNVSANAKGATELLKYRPARFRNVLELLVSIVLNPQNKDADAATMVLFNITHFKDVLEVCLDSLIPHLNDILNTFVNIDFNKKGAHLHYLALMFNSLSCNYRIRKWLTQENPHVPIIKLLPFCNYEQSNIRRKGVIGTIRNLSFDTEYHDFLLNNDLDLLRYILSPLMGNEDYPDEERDKLPISLQYLPKEKRREMDIDIRKRILETLKNFCMQLTGREMLRKNGVYYVLREYHKWEKDPKALLACENVVHILIQKEDEFGAENYIEDLQ